MKHIKGLSRPPMQADETAASDAKITFWSSFITAYEPVLSAKETDEEDS